MSRQAQSPAGPLVQALFERFAAKVQKKANRYCAMGQSQPDAIRRALNDADMEILCN